MNDQSHTTRAEVSVGAVTPTTTPATQGYPIPRPERGDDPRYCRGLIIDIAAVLTRYGYPPVSSGSDYVHWLMALHTAIYAPKETTT